MDEFWYVGSDNLIELEGLANAVTATAIDDATVSGNFTLTSDLTTSIATVAFTAEGSGGNYNGTLQDSVSMTIGKQYTLTVTITSGSTILIIRITRIASYKSL